MRSVQWSATEQQCRFVRNDIMMQIPLAQSPDHRKLAPSPSGQSSNRRTRCFRPASLLTHMTHLTHVCPKPSISTKRQIAASPRSLPWFLGVLTRTCSVHVVSFAVCQNCECVLFFCWVESKLYVFCPPNSFLFLVAQARKSDFISASSLIWNNVTGLLV